MLDTGWKQANRGVGRCCRPSKSSSCWIRAGSKNKVPEEGIVLTGRNPHRAGYGLEVNLYNDKTLNEDRRNPHRAGYGLEAYVQLLS